MWFKFRFFLEIIYIYIFGCQIHQIHVYHIIVFFLLILLFRGIYIKLFSDTHWVLSGRDLLSVCLDFPYLFPDATSLFTFTVCRMTVSVVKRALSGFFKPLSLFFSLLRDELWDTKSELCVVRIPSNLHVCFLNRACSLIPPSFSANRQEMQPGRSAIKQTLALKGVRGFVPARFAC